jgi:tetratricopeptide (TPR) repeat protein
MADGFTIWPLVPMIASLFAATLVAALAVVGTKFYRPFESNWLSAVVVTGCVLLTGAVVYLPTQSYAKTQDDRINKNWWELLDAGDASGAEQKLTQELDNYRHHFGALTPGHSSQLMVLAKVYRAQGRIGEAETVYHDTLELIAGELKGFEGNYRSVVTETVEFYFDTGDHESAKRTCVDAIAVAEGSDTLHVELLRLLAHCHRLDGAYADATDQYEDAMAEVEQLNKPELFWIGREYIEMLVELDRNGEATTVEARLAQIPGWVGI